MAVGAHADDRELNAGGTLSKYQQAGYEILYVISTNNMYGNWTTLDLANQPEAILSHSMESENIEHVANCLLVSAAYRKARQSGYRGMLLFWHDITPPPVASARRRWDSFIDVIDHWQAKLDVIALHACQIVDVNVLDLPAFGPACGCRQAEVFFLAERGEPEAHTFAPFSLEIFGHER